MAERGPRSLRTVARRGVAIGLLALGCNPPPAGNPPPAPAEASPEAAPAVEAPPTDILAKYKKNMKNDDYYLYLYI